MRYSCNCIFVSTRTVKYITARQCPPLWRKFIESSIIDPALSLLMKNLVTGQRQKVPSFSAFHWSPHGCLTFRSRESSTFTEKDRNKLNFRIGPKRTYSPNRTRLCGLPFKIIHKLTFFSFARLYCQVFT